MTTTSRAALVSGCSSGIGRATALALGRRIDGLAEDLVRDGQRGGDLREGDPATLVALVFGAFVGLTKQRRSIGRPLTDSDVAAAGDAVWHLVANQTTTTTTSTTSTSSKGRP